MRFFPELLTLVRGMARAMQPLGATERSGVDFHRGQRVSLSLGGGGGLFQDRRFRALSEKGQHQPCQNWLKQT